MGYILPIQQHEYADYQRRMITKKKYISTIEKPYKAILKMNEEEFKQEARVDSKFHPIKQREQPRNSNAYFDEKVFFEITGLGKYINERV